ncbi:MAG: hypothetical protein WCT19_03750 [Candidatus Paceibacterota bacterium]|jgi:hypothetical protein
MYKVYNDESGKKQITWLNTYVDKPTLAEVLKACQDNFPEVPLEKIGVLSGIMSLTIKEGHLIRGEGIDKG